MVIGGRDEARAMAGSEGEEEVVLQLFLPSAYERLIEARLCKFLASRLTALPSVSLLSHLKFYLPFSLLHFSGDITFCQL